jgi:hypothetical protein
MGLGDSLAHEVLIYVAGLGLDELDSESIVRELGSIAGVTELPREMVDLLTRADQTLRRWLTYSSSSGR